MLSEDEFEIPSEVFEEPANFRPPSPKPTYTEFGRNPAHVKNGPEILKVHLPPKHSLWAHKLWNAGRCMTLYLDEHPEMYKDKNVLELGAAAALPSIICAINGAKKVVSTDYPDLALTQNITLNAKENIPEKLEDGTFVVKGFIWGQNEADLDEPLTISGKFDLILLADVIFNHNQHHNMLKSCREMLAEGGIILTTFTHHVVKWADRDLKFFEIAKEFGFKSEKILEQKWDPMFPDDQGDIVVRSTVHGWILS